MKIAFVMDPIAGVDIDADTTFALMFAAKERGHQEHRSHHISRLCCVVGAGTDCLVVRGLFLGS